jgi:hypothetical protein
MASSMASAPAASVTHGFCAMRRHRGRALRLSAGAGKNGVVAGATDGFDQLLGRGQCRIEDYAGAMRHEIDVRGFDSGRRAQRLFHVMLAGGAGHAENGKRERFC